MSAGGILDGNFNMSADMINTVESMSTNHLDEAQGTPPEELKCERCGYTKAPVTSGSIKKCICGHNQNTPKDVLRGMLECNISLGVKHAIVHECAKCQWCKSNIAGPLRLGGGQEKTMRNAQDNERNNGKHSRTQERVWNELDSKVRG